MKRGTHYLNDHIGMFDNNEDWISCPFDTTKREIVVDDIKDGNYGSAIEKMYDMLSESLTKLYEHSIKKDFIGYRFYNIDKSEVFDAVINQIKKGRMAILPLNFNDVIDPLIISYLKESEKSKDKDANTYYKLFRRVFDSVRIVCMCKAENERLDSAIHNHLMWAHYAASHRGICVKYRIQPSSLPNQKDNIAFLSDVQYKDAKVNKHNLTLPQALLLKSKAWNYENECCLSLKKVDS